MADPHPTYRGVCRLGPLDGQNLSVSQPGSMFEVAEVMEHGEPPLRRVGRYEHRLDWWQWHGWSDWQPVDTWRYVESEKRWLRSF
jgi:hypothetical protein